MKIEIKLFDDGVRFVSKIMVIRVKKGGRQPRPAKLFLPGRAPENLSRGSDVKS